MKLLIFEINPYHMVTLLMNMGIVYLIQPREYLGTDIYKIGYSKQQGITRCTTGYGKNTRFMCIMSCIYPEKIEKIIKKVFPQKYKRHVGKEYFIGDEISLMDDFYKLVTNYNKECNNNSGYYSSQYQYKKEIEHDEINFNVELKNNYLKQMNDTIIDVNMNTRNLKENKWFTTELFIFISNMANPEINEYFEMENFVVKNIENTELINKYVLNYVTHVATIYYSKFYIHNFVNKSDINIVNINSVANRTLYDIKYSYDIGSYDI